jgi:hypothetical protein
MPLPERKGPLCRGPDCYTENGPCPGCHPDVRAAQCSSVPSAPEQIESSNGSLGAQRLGRVRWFLGWVLLVASVLVALGTIADGLNALIDLISTFL